MFKESGKAEIMFFEILLQEDSWETANFYLVLLDCILYFYVKSPIPWSTITKQALCSTRVLLLPVLIKPLIITSGLVISKSSFQEAGLCSSRLHLAKKGSS